MEALARGWNEQVDGPRPDVWTPASRSWSVLLQQRTAPRTRATWSRPRRPRSRRRRWSSRCRSRWPRRSAGRTSRWAGPTCSRWPATRRAGAARATPSGARSSSARPTRSSPPPGLNATIGAYFAATGRSTDLTAEGRHQPEGRRVRQGDRGLGRALRRHHADLPGEPLPGRRGRPRADVHQRGDGRGEVGLGLQPGQPLGRPGARSASAASRGCRWSRSTRRRARSSPTTRTWCSTRSGWTTRRSGRPPTSSRSSREPAQQKRFTDAAFRDASGRPGAALTRRTARCRTPKLSVHRPAARRRCSTRSRRPGTSLRKRARVLLVLDIVRLDGRARCPAAAAPSSTWPSRPRSAAPAQLAPDDERRACGRSPRRPAAQRSRTASWCRPGAVSAGAADVASRRSRTWRPTAAPRSTRPPGTRSGRCRRVLRPAAGSTRSCCSPTARTSTRRTTTSTGCCRDSAARTPRRRCGSSRSRTGRRPTWTSSSRSPTASRAAAYDASDPASIDNVLTAVLSNF